MTIDERLERLTKRHQAPTGHIEQLTRDVETLRGVVAQDAGDIRSLARIAEIREHRLSPLEGNHG